MIRGIIAPFGTAFELTAQHAAEVKKESELQIAYVLFIDIVSYSNLLINEPKRRNVY